LFGLFEVNLSGRVLGAAGTLSSRHGAAGAFFNGVLATILATPCTAPFLGAALGFALTTCADHRSNFPYRGCRSRLALRAAQLESGMAEIPAAARGLDGEIQNCHG